MNQNPNYSPYEPWNQDTYRTGSTRPPKKRWGLIAVLLTLVILLGVLVYEKEFWNVVDNLGQNYSVIETFENTIGR